MLNQSRLPLPVALTVLLVLSLPNGELLAQRGGGPGRPGIQENTQGGRAQGPRGRGQGDGQQGDFQAEGRPPRGEAEDRGGRGDGGRGAERGGNPRGGDGNRDRRAAETRGRTADSDQGRGRAADRDQGRGRRTRQRVEKVELRDQVINQLKALDLNQNGSLDPSEANHTSLAIMKEIGLDPGFPISLETLVMLTNQLDLEQIDFPLETGVFVREPTSLEFQAPRSRARDPGFSDTTHPLMSDSTPLEERYSPTVLMEVRSLLQRYDENGNGVLDPEEIARVPWSAPHPKESDLDQNGVLSQIELAERLSQFTGDLSSPRPRRNRGRAADANDEQQAGGRDGESEREQRAAERAVREQSRRQSARTDRVDTYVKDLISKLDKDGDGMVSAEELEAMRNKPPTSADTNEDGLLSYAELYSYYSDGESPSASSGSSSGSGSQSALADAIRWDGAFPTNSSEGTGWPSDLSRMDRDGDGMISLAEYNNYGKEISEATRESFRRLDLNGDGFITIAEANAGGARPADTANSSTSTAGRGRATGGGDAGRGGRGRGGFGGRTDTGNASQRDSGQRDSGQRDSGQRDSNPPLSGTQLPNTIRFNFGG